MNTCKICGKKVYKDNLCEECYLPKKLNEDLENYLEEEEKLEKTLRDLKDNFE